MAIDFGCRPRIVSCIYLFIHCNFPAPSIKTLLLSHPFLGYLGMLGVVPRSAFFMRTPAASVQSSTAWQLSTMKDLIHKAGQEFRDKTYIWNHTQKEIERRCRLLRAEAE